MGKIEVYTDVQDKHRWRLKAGNGEIVAVSEGYATRSGAMTSASKVKQWAANAIIVEIN